MKQFWCIIALGIAFIGCNKQQESPPPVPSAPSQQAATAPPPAPATPPKPIVDPLVEEEKEYRFEADQMLSAWRGGKKPARLMGPILVTTRILLDYQIVSLDRHPEGGTDHVNYTGTVNLQLQNDNGPPSQRQYKMLVTVGNDGWTMYLSQP
jgi:hypothetical protein